MNGDMAEQVDAGDLKSPDFGRVGSTPLSLPLYRREKYNMNFLATVLAIAGGYWLGHILIKWWDKK